MEMPKSKGAQGYFGNFFVTMGKGFYLCIFLWFCRRNHNHIWQVLMYARTIFYKINTMDPLNPEAAVLWVVDSVSFL